MWLRNATDPYTPAAMDAANEDTKMLFTKDYRHAKITMIVDNSFSGTVKFYTSTQEARPDLDSAVSATNQYQTVDLVYTGWAIGWSKIDWNTWFVSIWSDDWQYALAVNEDLQTWIWAVMTARVAWDVTLTFQFGNNS